MLMVKEKNGQIFSAEILTWLISIIMGILLPLFTQSLVIEQVANLSSMPATTSSAPVENSVIVASALILWGLFLAYVFAFAFQIYFIAKTTRFSSVFALIVTMASPITIWVALPYLLL